MFRLVLSLLGMFLVGYALIIFFEHFQSLLIPKDGKTGSSVVQIFNGDQASLSGTKY